MRSFRIQVCGAWNRVFAYVLLSLSGGGPVLAQTLPLTVDPHAAGVRPAVEHQGGVPVIQIAPPAAGVSNNKFTEFNVGPSGVILNNSGAASQTQLAGQIAGNPHLGRNPATTILNQVTARNPSQLRGLLEVAGSRANVIVANPAGITCDGPVKFIIRIVEAQSTTMIRIEKFSLIRKKTSWPLRLFRIC
ncbi:hypothetical protein GCM10027287_36560 [Bordetella muralis]